MPAYLYVPSFDTDSGGPEMDIFSHNITDVWLYVDNNSKGGYELPALIPVAASGKHVIGLRPGIKNAGMANVRRPYPFYELFEFEANLRPGLTDTIAPVTFYDEEPEDILVSWNEDFESLGQSYEIKNGSDTVITIISREEDAEKVFNGNRTAAVYMDESGLLFEMISPLLQNLPKNNIPIYLEINYKSNQSFVVGLYSNNKSEQIPIYVINSQDNWNKIYLDFTSFIQQFPNGTPFNIFIGFSRDKSLSLVELYLDDIKVIHY